MKAIAQPFKNIWNAQKGVLYAEKSIDNNNLSKFLNKMLINLVASGPYYFFVFDFATLDFAYIDPNAEKILGIKLEEFTIDRFASELHPTYLEHIVRYERIGADFLINKVPLEDRMDYKSSYFAKRKVADGSYALFLHQAITIEFDEHNQISRTLSVDTRIDHLIKHDIFSFSMIGLNGKPSYYNINAPNYNGGYLMPKTSFFSIRELEIIRLFADGFTAKEIAGSLHISQGTVRTHRQNVLRKTNCRNMVGLVAWCIREGWI
jgi:DNA-binding CsgD family transcriptional regulator